MKTPVNWIAFVALVLSLVAFAESHYVTQPEYKATVSAIHGQLERIEAYLSAVRPSVAD